MKIIIHKKYLDIVSEKFPNIEFYTEIDDCPEAEALIGEPMDFVPEKLDKMPNIRWLQSFRAGYDTLDLDYMKKRNITFCNGKDIYSIPIAEDVVCKILMHNTNAMKFLKSQREHKWEPFQKRTEFHGQTVGIIGTGSIATEIAKRLQGFGVKIIGYKRTPVSAMAFFDEITSGKKGLEYLMSNSDYIIVTVDLNKDTYHMINKDTLKFMKESASIINIARGSIINQKDLTEALKNKSISYAGLDVFEVEPLPEDDELWDLENVYITPHASEFSGTYDSACMAKNMIGRDDIYIIDTRSVCLGAFALILEAIELVQQNKDIEEIVKELEALREKVVAVAALDTLKYLEKGGRLSKGQAVVGSLLNVKPIVAIKDGKINVIEKIRGKNKAVKWFDEWIAKNNYDLSNKTVLLFHGKAYEQLKMLRESIEDKYKIKNIIEQEIGAVIGTHSGPGVLGIGFVNK